MKTRMQPIGNAWQKLPRIVRDLSAELGKQIELEMHGAETELDRQVLDLIKDPLTHMVRNSADHGLETPAERRAAGKPEQGTIRLSACHEGGHIIIEIADDGRGLDTERIKAKVDRASGSPPKPRSSKMSEAQIHKFIFAPGFSTADKVTSVSGRGVGMDVVRTNIDQIGGTIDVKSVAGRGHQLHHQDSAHARHRLGADRGGRRRALRDPAARGGRAGARAQQFRAPHRAHQGCAGAAPAQQAAAARPPRRRCSRSTSGDRGRSRERLHRGDAGRQPDLRHRGRRRVPHRGDRGEADVEQAAPHRDVLRQHHPRRRLGDHDHRSERHRAGDRHRRRPRSRRAADEPRAEDQRRPRQTVRCSCSAPARRSRRRCRCRW